MARFVEVIDLPVPPSAAFEYLASFHRTAEWDPGVVEAEPLAAGEPRLGSRFRVVVSVLGRRIPFAYEITAFEPPTRLVLVGSDGWLRSIDEISFAPRPGGTRVTYEARLELPGPLGLLDPLLDLAFQRVGRLATRGLRDRFESAGDGRAAVAPRAA